MPVAAVIGAIVGAGARHSEEEVTDATAALKKALAEAAPDVGLRNAIVDRVVAASGGRYRIRALSAQETRLADEDLAGLGIDTILQLEVSRIDLAVFGRIDPDAAIALTVRAGLHATTGGLAHTPASWTYIGDRHNYFKLAADNAGLLRDLMNRSYEEISAFIVADLFCGRPPPGQGDWRDNGIRECAGNRSDSNPRASTARASSTGPIE